MPKRRRQKYNDKERYRKRTRHFSVSPSNGDDIITENASKLRNLQLEVDILRAQVNVLRRQLDELRREEPTGEKVENRTCSIM